MKPTLQQLKFCCDQLTKFIPTPPRPVAKPQLSKWGFKVGNKATYSGNSYIYEVSICDSLGLTFTKLRFLTSEPIELTRVETKDEIAAYTRLKMARRRRKVREVPLDSYDIDPGGLHLPAPAKMHGDEDL